MPNRSVDERKRQSNLRDHGIDFVDAPLVFDALRLTLDDVVSSSSERGRTWKAGTFYTHFSTSLEAVQEMSVSDELLQDIGIARLSGEFESEGPDRSGDA